MTLSSSAARVFVKNCPRALDHYEAQVPYPRDVFGAGIVAHAAMQAVGEKLESKGGPVPSDTLENIRRSVVFLVSTAGRSYQGHAEPPIPLESALAGSSLSVAYLQGHDFPTGRVEVGLAADAEWRAVPYADPAAFYHGIVDVLGEETTEDDEGYTSTGIVVRDWKSAWGAGAKDLESLQLKGYAILAVADFEARNGRPPDWIRLEITNLRTGTTYANHLDLDEAGMLTLVAWQRELTILVKATQVRPRLANPGPRCMGCPYVLVCKDAEAWLRTSGVPADPKAAASLYAVFEAAADALAPYIREACQRGEMAVPGGSVGYHAQAISKIREDAIPNLVGEFLRVPEKDRVRHAGEFSGWYALLDALKLGAGNMSAAVRRLYPTGGKGVTKAKREDNKEKRANLEPHLLTTTTRTVFGIVSDAGEVDIDNDPAAQAEQGEE